MSNFYLTPHRDYEPALGRWMSPDSSVDEPVGPGGVKVVNLADPQTWNMYAYVKDNPTTLNDPSGLGARCTGQNTEHNNVLTCEQAQAAAQLTATLKNSTQERAQKQNEQEVEAEVYGEKTNGTVNEYKAMASVIVNRANSGSKAGRQYVQKGQDVNIHNVVSNTKQLQAYGGTNYNNFYNGSPKVSQTTRANVETAVTSVFSQGATTKATFFIAPAGGAPTCAEVRALGNVTPANPASVGGVYLYEIKPPGP